MGTLFGLIMIAIPLLLPGLAQGGACVGSCGNGGNQNHLSVHVQYRDGIQEVVIEGSLAEGDEPAIRSSFEHLNQNMNTIFVIRYDGGKASTVRDFKSFDEIGVAETIQNFRHNNWGASFVYFDRCSSSCISMMEFLQVQMDERTNYFNPNGRAGFHEYTNNGTPDDYSTFYEKEMMNDLWDPNGDSTRLKSWFDKNSDLFRSTQLVTRSFKELSQEGFGLIPSDQFCSLQQLRSMAKSIRIPPKEPGWGDPAPLSPAVVSELKGKISCTAYNNVHDGYAGYCWGDDRKPVWVKTLPASAPLQ
jgi:hypothetical protein